MRPVSDEVISHLQANSDQETIDSHQGEAEKKLRHWMIDVQWEINEIERKGQHGSMYDFYLKMHETFESMKQEGTKLDECWTMLEGIIEESETQKE